MDKKYEQKAFLKKLSWKFKGLFVKMASLDTLYIISSINICLWILVWATDQLNIAIAFSSKVIMSISWRLFVNIVIYILFYMFYCSSALNITVSTALDIALSNVCFVRIQVLNEKLHNFSQNYFTIKNLSSVIFWETKLIWKIENNSTYCLPHTSGMLL